MMKKHTQSESFVVTSNNEILKSYRLLTSIQEIVDKFLQGACKDEFNAEF